MVMGAGPPPRRQPDETVVPIRPSPDSAGGERGRPAVDYFGCLTLLLALALCFGVFWAWPWLMATRDGWYMDWEAQKAKQKAVSP